MQSRNLVVMLQNDPVLLKTLHATHIVSIIPAEVAPLHARLFNFRFLQGYIIPLKVQAI